jgi:hypothetical protein
VPEDGKPADDIREMIRAVVEEFARGDPARQAELTEERKRRESLEQRVNDLVAENSRSRAAAEEAERSASIRAELQRLGVTKVDLAYRAVKDDVYRSEDGRILAQGGAELREYLAQFVGENPELLPARIGGGSGTGPGQRLGNEGGGGVDLAKIRPGMDAEELERARQEVARVAAQTLRGL